MSDLHRCDPADRFGLSVVATMGVLLIVMQAYAFMSGHPDPYIGVFGAAILGAWAYTVSGKVIL